MPHLDICINQIGTIVWNANRLSGLEAWRERYRGRRKWGKQSTPACNPQHDLIGNSAFTELLSQFTAAMAGGNYIDLLSSDDEVVSALPASRAALKPAVKSTTAPPAPLHEDGVSNTVYLEDIDNMQPIKKRKLNSLSRAKAMPTESKEIPVAKTAWKAAKDTACRTDDAFAVVDFDDPLIFTSSARGETVGATLHGRPAEGTYLDMQSEASDCSFPEDIFSPSYKPIQKSSTLSGKTADFLSDFDNLEPSRKVLSSNKSRKKLQEIPKKLCTNENPHGSMDGDIFLLDKAPTAPGPNKGPLSISNKTRALLASLSNRPEKSQKKLDTSTKPWGKAAPPGVSLESTSIAQLASGGREEEEMGEIESNNQAKKSRLTEEERVQRHQEKEREKEVKAHEKQVSRAQKAKEKENELARKRVEKEEKAKQKQKDAEIAEVNKAKLDKKDSTPEMIVDLPASVHGQRVDTQTREFLRNLDVETSLYQSTIPDVIKWRRKVKAKWNTVEGLWEPLARMQIEDEKHVACIMPAADFISLCTAQDDEDNIDTHVSKLKGAYPNCVPIYLIEGLTKKMRESKTAANRQYQNHVVNQGQTDGTSSSRTNKRKKAVSKIVDENVIEDVLLRLQVIHNCLIHHTAFHVETAEWIATFTQHISTIPYK